MTVILPSMAFQFKTATISSHHLVYFPLGETKVPPLDVVKATISSPVLSKDSPSWLLPIEKEMPLVLSCLISKVSPLWLAMLILFTMLIQRDSASKLVTVE